MTTFLTQYYKIEVQQDDCPLDEQGTQNPAPTRKKTLTEGGFVTAEWSR